MEDGYKIMEKKYMERANKNKYINTYTQIQNLYICIYMHTNMKKRKKQRKRRGRGWLLKIRKLFIKCRRIKSSKFENDPFFQ